MSSFSSDVTFDDILDAAGVKLSPKGLYLEKAYRNCDSLAAVFSGVRLALSAKDREIQRLHKALAESADQRSKEASKRAAAAEENKELVKLAIRRGLEATDLPPATRDRLLLTNAS